MCKKEKTSNNSNFEPLNCPAGNQSSSNELFLLKCRKVSKRNAVIVLSLCRQWLVVLHYTSETILFYQSHTNFNTELKGIPTSPILFGL
jgi:hypothetical protein